MMPDEARRTFSLTIHPWCMSPSRDEAVRAAEDGRSGPLPTLEEAIDAVTERRPPEPGEGRNVTGSLTERVTLEVTHDLDAPLGEWIVQVIDESLGFDETVRVVEECCLDRINMGEVIRQRDAAIRERDKLRAERITQALTADRFAAAVQEADRLRARVAELESAPAASGAAGTEAAGTELPTE